MTLAKFKELWKVASEDWFNEATVSGGKSERPVSDFCELEDNCFVQKLFDRYNIIKKIVKQDYYNHNKKRATLNKYRRAAVLIYAVNESEPLRYKGYDPGEKPLFLKQRLAIHVGIISILSEFRQEEVRNLDGVIFDPPALSEFDQEIGADDFNVSMYKDLYFSERYQNYNVLTMSNLLWLLTEKASKLNQLCPYSSKDDPDSGDT